VWALELLRILLRRRRFIIVNTLIVTVAAVIISILLPKTFSGKATVLPPESESPLAGLMGLSAGSIAAAVTNFALPIMATPSDLYASMLESESVLKQVVDSLKLQSVYNTSTEWAALTKLKDNVKIKVGSDGIITVEAFARDRQLAADIANLMVGTLDQFNRRLQNQKGREFSSFLEKRLAETDSALGVAQNVMKNFQENHRAVSLELQSEALITNLAQQKAQLTSSEIQLEILKKTLYPNHPELVKKQMEVGEIRSKLKSMEEGATNVADSTLSALDIPLSRVPDLSLRFAVLKRNLKIQELTYELLSQQLEMARLQKRRDTPTLMVLDHARPAEAAVKPQKRLIVLAALFLTFVCSAGIVVAEEIVRRRREEGSEVLRTLETSLRELKNKPLG
jgi:tyrosine-protein kinase Etk/Wzc